MKSLKSLVLLGLCAGSIGLSGLVAAQSSAPAPGERATPDRAKMAEKMKQRMEKRIAQMHDKLKITADQEAAWKTFTDAMAPGPMPVPADRQAMAKLSAPERMEKMLEKMQERQAKMQSRLAALKTFYAVLTPEQQKVFDESHRHMGEQMRHRIAEHMRDGGHPMPNK